MRTPTQALGAYADQGDVVLHFLDQRVQMTPERAEKLIRQISHAKHDAARQTTGGLPRIPLRVV